MLGEPEVGQVQQDRGLVQDSHHDLLPVDRGEGRDAQVDLLAADLQRDAAVLGDAPLGDVEVGHDLEAADDAGVDLAGLGGHLVQDAVDAVAHPHLGLLRLDVDVGGAVTDRLGDQGVDELDDRRVVQRVGGLEVVEVLILSHQVPGEVVDAVPAQGGELVQHRHDVAAGGHDRHHVGVADGADVVQRDDVGRVAHRDLQPPLVVEPEREDAVAPRHVVGQEAGRHVVDVLLAQLDELKAQVLGERRDEAGLGEQPHLDQDATERPAGALLLLAGPGQVLRRDEALLEEDVGELSGGVQRGRGYYPAIARDSTSSLAARRSWSRSCREESGRRTSTAATRMWPGMRSACRACLTCRSAVAGVTLLTATT